MFCLSTLQQRAAGLLLWARLVGDIGRLLHRWRRSSTARSSKCGQCRVYGRPQKLNADLLNLNIPPLNHIAEC